MELDTVHTLWTPCCIGKFSNSSVLLINITTRRSLNKYSRTEQTIFALSPNRWHLTLIARFLYSLINGLSMDTMQWFKLQNTSRKKKEKIKIERNKEKRNTLRKISNNIPRNELQRLSWIRESRNLLQNSMERYLRCKKKYKIDFWRIQRWNKM